MVKAESLVCTINSKSGQAVGSAVAKVSLVPRPEEEEEEEKGPGFSCNYLGFNHVLISRRVPMTSSKSHE